MSRSRSFQPPFLWRVFGFRWKLSLGSKFQIIVKNNGVFELDAASLRSISIERGMLWHRIELRWAGRVDRLDALSRLSAEAIEQALLIHTNAYLTKVIRDHHSEIEAIEGRLQRIIDEQSQYLSRSDISRVIRSVSGSAALALAHPLLKPDLLGAEARSALTGALQHLQDDDARRAYNDRFVDIELERSSAFFDDIAGFSLSDEQREACIRLEDDNLLIACAGSGKTATMVAKVAYLIEKQICDPKKLLVLAFNRGAAAELRERIANELNIEPRDLGCDVRTFHALGRGIIQQVRGAPPQLANWTEHPAGEAKVLKELIDNLLQENQDFQRSWLELLTVFPKALDVKERIDRDADYLRYLDHRERAGHGTIGTLSGIFVKSLQERRIADWLWLYSIKFKYEQQVRIDQDTDGTPPTAKFYHPDFAYPELETIHEHFALNSDGSSPFEHYAEHAEEKRRDYIKAGLNFFETTSGMDADGSLLRVLEKELGTRGCEFKLRSFEEIEKALEPAIIHTYHKLFLTCIKHIRSNNLTFEQLQGRCQDVRDSARARRFIEVLWPLACAYSDRLKAEERIDFESMLADASSLIETGAYAPRYEIILIDEFQDVSASRARMIKALRHQQHFAKIFAVGDDWQSIYRFAGSDISIFTNFEEHFGQGWRGKLQQTFRSNQLIAKTAAEFVQRNPAQIAKSVKSARSEIPESIRVVPVKSARDVDDFGKACQAILRRLDTALERRAEDWRDENNQKLKVMLLWRFNYLKPQAVFDQSYKAIEVIGYSFHRSKGREADYTILIDVSEDPKGFGVPSLIEDDELIDLVMPRPERYANAEERRLFYVALTRARRGAFLLVNESSPSRFVRELCEINGDQIRFETAVGETYSTCPVCLVGQVVTRIGSKGAFLGCNQFPDCRYTSSADPSKICKARDN